MIISKQLNVVPVFLNKAWRLVCRMIQHCKERNTNWFECYSKNINTTHVQTDMLNVSERGSFYRVG